MTVPELYNPIPTTSDEGTLGVIEPIEPEIPKKGIVTQEEWAEAMVGRLTKQKMMLGKIIARFEGDVIIKDDNNVIDVTFSKDISPENKAEIQNLILKLFEEINESPIIVRESGLT